MDDTYKLRIKIGDAEFEAEGEKATVDAQYAAFLAALSTQPPAASKAPPSGEVNEDKPPADTGTEKADEGLMARAFQKSKDMISLNALPRTAQKEADTLLLLLYGYAELQGQDMVLGTKLIQAARQSGITLDRVDRVIAKHDQLLLKGGQRKGVKYGLNNQGKAKAREILTDLFSA